MRNNNALGANLSYRDGLAQAIEAAPKDGNPVFPVDQHTGDVTTADWAVLQGVSSHREGASIAFLNFSSVSESIPKRQEPKQASR